ncbi:hypothetical protein [Janibacter corallicola]|uniref:hypothetical protein n=1 Tax=Janibacter corallicola TaxID=415212 RepID=UPI0012EE9F9F|nr:hypothetical protein [Janibacter corallicola]
MVQRSGYDIGGLSNEMHQMFFRSGKSATSWGHMYAVTVLPSGSESTLNLTVTGIPGAPTSLMDGRKNKKAAQKFLSDLEAVFQGDEGPFPEPVESFAVLSDGTTVPWTEGDYPGV